MTVKRTVLGGLSVLYFFIGCTSVQPVQTTESATLEQSLADTRKQMEELQHRLSVIQFMVDSHEKTILDLKRSAQGGIQTSQSSALPPLASEPTAASVAEEYNLAFSAMKDKQYAEAASRFSAVARNHPAHDLADNALYWAGECYYTEKKYKEAISAFNQVVEQYTKQSKAPDALLKIGFAYLSIGDLESARHHLIRVIQEYPRSEAKFKARQKLKQIPNP